MTSFKIFTNPHLLDGQRWAGMRVGLLGGAFNPPHEGHAHISEVALKTLELDAVWWLVTPRHPYQSKSNLPPLKERMDLCNRIVTHPRILVTALENDLGVSRSFKTVRALKKRFSATDFVWVTGMDNALTLHHWYRWQDLMAGICMAHIVRPPAHSVIQQCPVRMMASRRHFYPVCAGRHPLESDITYWIMQKKMLNISSTYIRDNNI